jgi:hypothetical protein
MLLIVNYTRGRRGRNKSAAGSPAATFVADKKPRARAVEMHKICSGPAGTFPGIWRVSFSDISLSTRSANGRVRPVSEICCRMRGYGQIDLKSCEQGRMAPYRRAMGAVCSMDGATELVGPNRGFNEAASKARTKLASLGIRPNGTSFGAGRVRCGMPMGLADGSGR